jgi:hypothetical protein
LGETTTIGTGGKDPPGVATAGGAAKAEARLDTAGVPDGVATEVATAVPPRGVAGDPAVTAIFNNRKNNDTKNSTNSSVQEREKQSKGERFQNKSSGLITSEVITTVNLPRSGRRRKYGFIVAKATTMGI